MELKLSIISKSNATGGGASRIASELQYYFKKSSGAINSVHYTGLKCKNTRPFYGRFSIFSRKIRTIERLLGIADYSHLELLLAPSDNHWKTTNIFHVHDISSTFSPKFVSVLASSKPLVWTLHDCSPFTGGCISPVDCERYKKGCGRCPQIGTWPLNSIFDFTAINFKQKAILHRSANICYVSPSAWLSEKAFRSGILPSKPIVLSNGVDQSIFKPLNKIECRKKFGIPSNRLVVLILASSLFDGNKGVVGLSPAFEKLKGSNPYLVLVGRTDKRLTLHLNGLDHRFIGYIDDRLQLSQIYNSADILLYCTRADNQPLSVMEAMSCGLPIFGFGVGGIPEMLQNGIHGELVEYGLFEELIRKLEVCVRDSRLKKMGGYCADYAKDRYDVATMVKAYDNLYHKLLENENLG